MLLNIYCCYYVHVVMVVAIVVNISYLLLGQSFNIAVVVVLDAVDKGGRSRT